MRMGDRETEKWVKTGDGGQIGDELESRFLSYVIIEFVYIFGED